MSNDRLQLLDEMRVRIIVESAFRGGEEYTHEDNIEFAQAVCRWAIREGYNPYASHLFYPGILNDANPDERDLGMQLGLEMGIEIERALIALRPDEQMSTGVAWAFQRHKNLGRMIFIARFHPDGQFIRFEEKLNVH